MEPKLKSKIFKVKLDGASYWILGVHGTPEEMQKAIEDSLGSTFEKEGFSPIQPGDITEIEEWAAYKIPVLSDNESGVTSLWNAAHEAEGGKFGKHERVIASTEW